MMSCPACLLQWGRLVGAFVRNRIHQRWDFQALAPSLDAHVMKDHSLFTTTAD